MRRPRAEPAEAPPATMEEYYRRRAGEYDRIYDERGRPDRQRDLRRLKRWLVPLARGRTILEVAAGTGYWTAVAAPVAKRIVATDYNAETLDICRAKELGGHIECRVADAYALPELPHAFDLGMAFLWWSHVPKRRRHAFLAGFAARLQQGADVLMMDENFVEGFSSEVFADEAGDTFQPRRLDNGQPFDVLKNYPSVQELEASLGEVLDGVEVLSLKYYWAARGRVRPG
jgi:SAM-dependent methyltransferase